VYSSEGKKKVRKAKGHENEPGSLNRHLKIPAEGSPVILMVLALTSANFKTEVIDSKVPVLVDFWAEWCGPCRMFTPTMEALNKDYAGKVKFAKVNVDEESELAAEYKVMSIPTILLFKGGKIAASTVGAVPKDALKKWIDENGSK